MRRTFYLAAFVLLASLAALLTLRAQHTVAVVVATHDVRAGTALRGSDLEVRRLHDDAIPGGALSSLDAALGQYAAWPLTGGEPVLARSLRAQRSGGAVAGGLDVPAGYRAVAVPVQPAGAVGGMLAAGDRVDVFATPLPGRGTAVAATGSSGAAADGSTSGSAATIQLGHDVLVLELRTDQGQALDAQSADNVHGLNFGAGKLGSVVLAVPEHDVPAFAAATAVDSIYLALGVG